MASFKEGRLTEQMLSFHNFIFIYRTAWAESWTQWGNKVWEKVWKNGTKSTMKWKLLGRWGEPEVVGWVYSPIDYAAGKDYILINKEWGGPSDSQIAKK